MTRVFDANPVAAAAGRRRSARVYAAEPVTEAELHALLAATARAPSAWNLQPWRFVVVREPGLKLALREAAFGQAQVGAASAVVALYSDMAAALRSCDSRSAQAHFAALTAEARADWGAAQSNIALGYLLLVAEGMHLATSPMLGFDPAPVRALLELPPQAPISALIAIGRPDPAEAETAPGPRLDPETLIRWR